MKYSVVTIALASSFASLLQAASVTYDLTADWANNTNPNGVWTYAQGTTPLAWQDNMTVDGNSCFAGAIGITGAYASGTQFSSNPPCLPLIAKTTGDGLNPADWLAGDVVVHAFDPSNGGGQGEANIIWTAPVTGTISFTGDIWYAHSPVHRSDQFFVTLGSSTLASGTVAWNSGVGSSRNNMLAFAGSGPIAVTAGDQLVLSIERSSGSIGTIAGVQFAITETSADAPEPASALLGFAGVALVGLRIRRQKAQSKLA